MDRQQQQNSMPRQKNKFISCLPLPFFILFIVILGMGMLYLSFFTDIGYGGNIATDIITVIMLGILPWGLFIWFAFRFWQVIELSEKGIKRTFLKISLKYSMTWEENFEIRVIAIPTGGAWLFFSKTNLAGMSLGKAGRQKGQIKVAYSLKLHKAIRQFTDKEIIGVSDDILNKTKNDYL